MFLRVFQISGHSMMPTFSPGDKIIVSTLPYWFSFPKKGDIIIFKHDKKIMVKRISKIEGDYYLLDGDNKPDSLKIPKIKRKDILGKVIFILPKL